MVGVEARVPASSDFIGLSDQTRFFVSRPELCADTLVSTNFCVYAWEEATKWPLRGAVALDSHAPSHV